MHQPKIAFALIVSLFLARPLLSSARTVSDDHHVDTQDGDGQATACVISSPAQAYRVLAPNAIGIVCDFVTSLLPPDGTSTLELLPSGGASQSINVPITVTVPNAATHQSSVLIVYWPLKDGAKLQPGASYRLTLNYRDRGTGSTPGPLVVSINTTETLTLSGPNASQEFTVTSNLGFSLDGHTLATIAHAKSGPRDPIWQPCNITFSPTSPIDRAYNFMCSKMVSVSPDGPATVEILRNVQVGEVGRLHLQQKSLPGIPLIPSKLPFSDVLGGIPTFDPKSRIVKPSAPASKDSAAEYLNFNYAAGVGATPAWNVDAKYAPSLKIIKGFIIGPLATANIGNGKISGQTSADTIDLGATALHVFNPKVASSQYLLTFGATYETDRHFDRDNVLGTDDFQWLPLVLNNTQQRQQLNQWYVDLQDKAKSNEALTDISPYKFTGYDLDFHIGSEQGGNVIEHTQNASKGGASDILPKFPIFRIVPQAHALFQIRRVSFDELVVGRYLTTTEKTVVETTSNSLYVERLRGWKGVSTLNVIYALDTQGNLGITVKYTDGFSPPNYKRVNSVQAGIVLKY